MKLVPIVVLLEESRLELLQQWAAEPEIQLVIDILGDMAKENGWNADMLLGGMLLGEALER
jgi:uncharacterized protein YihD (DUF1040 family)